MSSIVLFHSITPIPQHLKDCVTKIRSISSIPIYLLTDTNIDPGILNLKTINITKYDTLNWLNQIDYFNNDLSFGHLWKSSCFRMFYIKQAVQEFNLEDVLHFDNDVLLYENPESIVQTINECNMKYAVTAHNADEIVMGMSFIKNYDSLTNLINFIENELKKGFGYLHSNYRGFPNEMQLISKSNLNDFLPILPDTLVEERYSKYFKKFNSVFDPSSYGQYLGGTFSEKTPGWFGTHQEIGKWISLEKIKVFMEDKMPYLKYEGQKIKINNLHIHSKQTGLFL